MSSKSESGSDHPPKDRPAGKHGRYVTARKGKTEIQSVTPGWARVLRERAKKMNEGAKGEQDRF